MTSPQPPKKPMVTCGNCGAENEPDRRKCRNCQQRLSIAAQASIGLAKGGCPGCGISNEAWRRNCHGCGESLPADPARTAAIAAIVAQAPPLNAQQITQLRRIFAGATPAREAA